MSRLLYIGFTHRTAPLSVRERLVPAAEAIDGYARSIQTPGSESAVLRTCGRFETFLAWASDGRPPEADAPTRVREILGKLSRINGCSDAELRAHAHVRTDDDAAEHLMRVAAGLDSPIPGEDHVLGQVRRCFAQGVEHGSVGPVLSALFRAAVRAGKRVRAETPLHGIASSFTKQAVDVLRERRARRADPRLLVLGSGAMAGEVCGQACHTGYERIIIAGRHMARVEALARCVGGGAIPFERVTDCLDRVDAVVACTSSSTPLLTFDMGARAWRHAAAAKHHRDILLIDLGMPRNIEADVARLPGVELHDIEALARRAGGSALESAQRAMQQATAIVRQELVRFRRWLAARELFHRNGSSGGTTRRRLAV